jgi:hypothetical protein
MTIPFIERMYAIPRGVLFEALNIPVEDNKEKSLKQLNEKYFPDETGLVLELVKTAVRTEILSPSATARPSNSP